MLVMGIMLASTVHAGQFVPAQTTQKTGEPKASSVDGGTRSPLKSISLVPQEHPTSAAITPMANAQVTALQAENKSLQEELSRRTAELKALQTALASANSRLKSAENEKQRLLAEMKEAAAVQPVPAVPVAPQQRNHEADTTNLISLVDSRGEAVFFNGVGEARMATTGDITIIRFPATAIGRADKMLMDRGASRLTHGRFVYFTIPSDRLVY